MVSLDRYAQYLLAFSRVIKDRGQTYRKILGGKKRIDVRILSQQYFSENDIKALLFVIGEDHLFRPAEKQHKQSLRHHLYKILKSLKFFLKRENVILSISRKIEGAYSFVADSCDLIRDYTEEIEHLLSIYQNQAEVVKGKNIKEYLSLCKLEEKKLKELFSFSGNTFQLNTNIKTFLKYLKQNKGSKDMGEFFAIILVFVGFGYLLFHFAVFIAAPEGYPPDSQKALIWMDSIIAFIISIRVSFSNRREIATTISRISKKIVRLVSNLNEYLTSS